MTLGAAIGKMAEGAAAAGFGKCVLYCFEVTVVSVAMGPHDIVGSGCIAAV